ncbi:MAG: CDP-archaeol synthase [Proteobacteria bacterium]|nr:CDP-archaeol synthase [Pseudomonadota bacterium]
MLKYRIITAVILIPIVIAAIFLPDPIWLSGLFALFIAIGAWEWADICKLKGYVRYIYSLFIIAVLACLYWLDNSNLYYSVILVGLIYWIIATLLVVAYQKGHKFLTQSPAVLMVVGLLLLVPMWSSLVVLKTGFNTGASFLIFLMLLIWSADTAAYFSGKRWGKRKLADRVSPGKTWEGTIAGILAGIVVTMCYVFILSMDLTKDWAFIVISIATVIMSVIGDLMESLVKREAGIKDSGSILPGHGGVMDRLDSLTAAGPVFVFGVIYYGYS